jgi:surface protein
MTTDMDGHDSFNTTAAEYYAGDVYTITQEAPVGYYLNRFDGAEVVQIGNNSWKGVMPKGDLAITLHYMPYISISGSIVWDDNDNERGTRPSSVKVHLMSGGESVMDTIVSADDNWEFTFNNVRPYVNGDAVEYSLHMEEVATYETSLNGNVITALYVPPTATISTSLWRANVNGYSQYSSSSSTGVLRSATSFSRINLPFVEALPSSAVRIDDGTTNSSIYFFMEGTDAFWWSDAEVVYMAPDSSWMFNECAELTSLDLSMFDTSKVTNMKDMFYMATSEGTMSPLEVSLIRR